ncbi:MAG: hypothetical protein J0L51_03130 [Rhizobiales bacterium]|nr:hypothetical protein [Hyphomicrobiales bacterium]
MLPKFLPDLEWRSLFTLVGFCLAWGDLVQAQTVIAEPNRITIAYEAPQNPAHRSLAEAMQARRSLELVQTILSPIRLPKPLHIKLAGCDGEINAWFEGQTITLCYEFIEWTVETARKTRKPIEVAEDIAITGTFLEVALHESAHAIFDYLAIPILGREEDAADQMAALWLLSHSGPRTGGFLAGIVNLYLDEAGLKNFKQLNRPKLRFGRATAFSDAHGTPIQRMYNTLCLAYGSDPDAYRAIAEKGALPAERAEGCEGEYRQVTHAFHTLIAPHVDQDLARKVYGNGAPLARP